MSDSQPGRRYYLTEPRTVIFGWVVSRREREVTADEYQAAVRKAGGVGLPAVFWTETGTEGRASAD